MPRSPPTNSVARIDINQVPPRRDPDQIMPIANVSRIMRRALPEHAKITDDAKEVFQECVTEFVSFVTSEANRKCNQEYRKTVTSQDILVAMESLGFDKYVEPLTTYMGKYRAFENSGTNSASNAQNLGHEANNDHEQHIVHQAPPLPPPSPPPEATLTQPWNFARLGIVPPPRPSPPPPPKLFNSDGLPRSFLELLQGPWTTEYDEYY
ncbi:nuclear transcription factor Y subunit B-8-like [Andrographis paniculata]|uniref:nuclear transcription factor Y subunit B-8-like n=1 Tax=Andrographis paniculata TaxID=175694 RepID=UPI0021E9A759|nr:nuclear transcription factor Y subunit B-8-like [Andrographis paniculata]